MAQAGDDEKNENSAWIKVFESVGKNKININEKVEQINEWGLQLMDMLHADKQDTDALCESLGLEGPLAKKFAKAVKTCLIQFSPWGFLKDTLDDEKQASELINKLNYIEKPASMISDDDIKQFCDECNINLNDVRNVIGWYKTLEPLTDQTKGATTSQMITEYIKKLYTQFDLPFFAMEEADEDDINQLAQELGFSKELVDFFKENVASQLKLQGLMTALKE